MCSIQRNFICWINTFTTRKLHHGPKLWKLESTVEFMWNVVYALVSHTIYGCCCDQFTYQRFISCHTNAIVCSFVVLRKRRTPWASICWKLVFDLRNTRPFKPLNSGVFFEQFVALNAIPNPNLWRYVYAAMTVSVFAWCSMQKVTGALATMRFLRIRRDRPILATEHNPSSPSYRFRLRSLVVFVWLHQYWIVN